MSQDLREQIAAYLGEQLHDLYLREALYLVEGVAWAARRIRGDPASEADFETAPSESLDEFLGRRGEE